MLAQRSGGSVVSVTASIADHPLAALSASVPMITKGGINAITRSLAMEYAKNGIRVNAVAPGVVDTPLLESVPKDFLRTLSPTGQIGDSRDIAEAVLYLSEASKVTGEVLHVDSGAHLGKWVTEGPMTIRCENADLPDGARIVSPSAAATGNMAAQLKSSEAQAQSDKPRAPAWPNKRLIDLLQIEHPIAQAPMAGSVGPDMAVAVSEAGGLGSFPCALLLPAQVRGEVSKIRARTSKPINLNFFCHAAARRDEAIEGAWRKRLAHYYAELDVETPSLPAGALTPVGKCAMWSSN
jgi:hypothetical protein